MWGLENNDTQMSEVERLRAELEKVKAESERANRARLKFLSRMSHDVRTPMNTILGMNEIIVKCSSDEDIRSYAEDAYRAAEELLDTIDEIIDFSRIESGGTVPLEEEYKLREMLKSIHKAVEARAREKGLKLVFDIDSDIPALLSGDDVRIRQVLINLLNNAIKYTETGSVTLKAVRERSKRDNVFIRFTVSDTGCGMKEEKVCRLAEVFANTDSEKEVDYSNTDLGMNIVFSLLRMLGAELEIGSVFGEGSTFSFMLCQVAVETTTIGEFMVGSGEVTDASARPMIVAPKATILAVDDNPVNLRVFQGLLKETGISIVAVTSGEEALRATKRKIFDVMFIDHLMPGMDGVELLNEIRRQENGLNREAPAVVLTANAEKGAEMRYRQFGFDEVLFKPASQSDLNMVLWKMIKEAI